MPNVIKLIKFDQKVLNFVTCAWKCQEIKAETISEVGGYPIFLWWLIVTYQINTNFVLIDLAIWEESQVLKRCDKK